MAKFKDMCFKRTNIGGSDSLLPQSLELLEAFDGVASMSEIRKRVGLESSVFKDCFLDLFKKKLIVEVNKPNDRPSTPVVYLDTSEIEKIKNAVVQVAGPLGEMLVQDVLEQMNLIPSQIPQEKLQDIIEAVSDSIPGEKQAAQFRNSV